MSAIASGELISAEEAEVLTGIKAGNFNNHPLRPSPAGFGKVQRRHWKSGKLFGVKYNLYVLEDVLSFAEKLTSKPEVENQDAPPPIDWGPVDLPSDGSYHLALDYEASSNLFEDPIDRWCQSFNLWDPPALPDSGKWWQRAARRRAGMMAMIRTSDVPYELRQMQRQNDRGLAVDDVRLRKLLQPERRSAPRLVTA